MQTFAVLPLTCLCRVLRTLRCIPKAGDGRASPTALRCGKPPFLTVSQPNMIAWFVRASHSVRTRASEFRRKNHPVSRGGCHPSFVRRGAFAPPLTIHYSPFRTICTNERERIFAVVIRSPLLRRGRCRRLEGRGKERRLGCRRSR